MEEPDMRAAIYARYSTDLQSAASVEDQIRLCAERAEREGWSVVRQDADRGISGASLLRPGLQAMLQGAARGEFDVLIAEALDRLSRDQEDIAGLYKRLGFAGIRIVTLAEGEISELHIGLKGTMNALFLKDLAQKTRRGQRGRVEAGKIPGGNSYGYRMVRRLEEDGAVSTGEREVDEREARIVRRIFAEYAAGLPRRRIAAGLNREGVPGPRGGAWAPGTPRRSMAAGSGGTAASTTPSISGASPTTGSAS
jgi:DNA invertase Pin-like site-specific DNA recombinase